MGEVIEFQKNGEGAWSLVQPPTLPDGTDQTSITSAIAQIGTVRVLNELTNTPGLDVIGLDNPTSTITLSLDTGEKFVIEVGDPSPTGNGYYIRLNGSATKLVDKPLIDRFIGFITAPRSFQLPSLPTHLSYPQRLRSNQRLKRNVRKN
ncbi:MAG: DUF4340 domain-containing protein [Anaerolineae bacterium]|nr:DUF4340 domain-containing protein [Anaerolineae bacterium]